MTHPGSHSQVKVNLGPGSVPVCCPPCTPGPQARHSAGTQGIWWVSWQIANRPRSRLPAGQRRGQALRPQWIPGSQSPFLLPSAWLAPKHIRVIRIACAWHAGGEGPLPRLWGEVSVGGAAERQKVKIAWAFCSALGSQPHAAWGAAEPGVPGAPVSPGGREAPGCTRRQHFHLPPCRRTDTAG